MNVFLALIAAYAQDRGLLLGVCHRAAKLRSHGDKYEPA